MSKKKHHFMTEEETNDFRRKFCTELKENGLCNDETYAYVSGFCAGIDYVSTPISRKSVLSCPREYLRFRLGSYALAKFTCILEDAFEVVNDD